MAISGYLLSQQPRLYRAQVAMLVGSSLQSARPDPSAIEASVRLAHVYADLTRRPLVMQAVIDGLGLPQGPEKLAEQVTAVVQPDAQVLEINVVDSSPEAAQAIADATAQALLNLTPATQQSSQAQLAFIKEQLDEMQGSIQALEGRLRDVNASLAQLAGPIEVENAEREAAALRTLLETQRSSYARLLEFYRESTSSVLTIIEPARAGIPLSRQLPLSLLTAAVAGGMLAVGGIYVSERIDGATRWEEPCEPTCLGLPILGAIGTVSRRSGPLFYARDPHSQAADALRHLRTSVYLAGANGAPRSLLVTSPSRLDGKSFVATNLATAMAAGGSSVALVDANWRSPTLHEIFDVQDSPGLSDALISDQPWSEAMLDGVLQPAGYERLWVLPAGLPPADPALTLASGRLRQVLALLQARCQLVIIDGPPESSGPEASILAAVSEATILVVSPGWTSRQQALHSREEIARRPSANLAGIVHNRSGSGRRRTRPIRQKRAPS